MQAPADCLLLEHMQTLSQARRGPGKAAQLNFYSHTDLQGMLVRGTQPRQKSFLPKRLSGAISASAHDLAVADKSHLEEAHFLSMPAVIGHGHVGGPLSMSQMLGVTAINGFLVLRESE